MGATASGKSSIALEVARRLAGVELVSVDAMQVYRGMDIGTAKPTSTEQAEVRHHCIDLADATDDFTVADFQQASRAALASIDERDANALYVGGTGLYHRVVIDDFDLPGEFPAVRAELEAELFDAGGAGDADAAVAALHARLAGLDPQAAARMEPTNRRRVIRALEVTIGSGRRFSSFGPGLDSYPHSPVTQIGIRRTRSDTAERVERRVHAMVDAGLVDEVTGLHERGFSRTAGQALGYKEIVDHLEGRIGQDEAIRLIITRTRQFAVRQERWFRRDPRVTWIDIEGDSVDHCAVEVIPTLLDRLRR